MCSSALANFFIERAKKENIEISNLKLQKLMFIGYGWVLAVLDKDLTDGEGFQAWAHGPVLPSIYHEMKRYGDSSLNSLATDYDNEENKTYNPVIQNEQDINVLNKVWDIYKKFSAWSLRNLTHESGSPWQTVYSQNSLYIPIDKNTVKEYYTDYISKLLSSNC